MAGAILETTTSSTTDRETIIETLAHRYPNLTFHLIRSYVEEIRSAMGDRLSGQEIMTEFEKKFGPSSLLSDVAKPAGEESEIKQKSRSKVEMAEQTFITSLGVLYLLLAREFYLTAKSPNLVSISPMIAVGGLFIIAGLGEVVIPKIARVREVIFKKESHE